MLQIFKNSSFAVPVAPAPRRRTPRQRQQRSDVTNQSFLKIPELSNSTLSSKLAADSAPFFDSSILENATVHPNENIFSSKSSETSRYSVEIITKSRHAKRFNVSTSFNFQRSSHSFSNQIKAASQTQVSNQSRVSGLLISTEWEACILRALTAASESFASAEDGSFRRALLLVRGDYVRQRDIRAMLASRVHPTLLESVITILLPLHAPFTCLAQLAAIGAVPMISSDEDSTEPLFLLTELLAALHLLAPQLGLVFDK